MNNVIEFPRKKATPAPEPEPKPEPRQSFARAPRPAVERPAEQGVLNQVPVGKYAAILPDVTDEHHPIEALLAAASFYAVGGVDHGKRAQKALAKFQQAVSASTPQPPSAA